MADVAEHCVTWTTKTTSIACASDVIAYSLYPRNKTTYVDGSLCCTCGWEFKGSVRSVETIARRHLVGSA